jgi:hypothetical protein
MEKVGFSELVILWSEIPGWRKSWFVDLKYFTRSPNHQITKAPHRQFFKNGETMTEEDARQRIQTAIDQYGQQAGMAIDLVISETRSDLGVKTANDLIEEFDLELLYNIAPTESYGSGDWVKS